MPLTVAEARARGRAIVLAHPEGIGPSAISAQILAEHPDMAAANGKPNGTIRGATWDLHAKFPSEIVKGPNGFAPKIKSSPKHKARKAAPRGAVNVRPPKSEALTGAAAGFNGAAQVRIAVKCILDCGGTATTQQLYDALEAQMKGRRLSEQGKASLRFYVNKIAVRLGLVYAHVRSKPGWHITPKGRRFLVAPPAVVTLAGIDKGQQGTGATNSARGSAFERYVLDLLRLLYPGYAWYPQGEDKKNERGLDFIGNLVKHHPGEPGRLGVQAKCHAPGAKASQEEWTKFLEGCTLRQVDRPIFITTGRLSSKHHQEAQLAGVLVIQGRDEIDRFAKEHGLYSFEYGSD